MKTHVRTICIAFMLLAGVLILIPKECNAQLKKMTTEDLTNESTAILYGKCSKIESKWNEGKDIIFTTVTVLPDEYIKGDLGSEALITIPGGQVDDIIYEVSEMPVFIEGEDVFAFVWKHPSGKNLITGGKQGKMKIKKDKDGKKVVKGVANGNEQKSAKKEAKVEEILPPQEMLLEDFTEVVKGYLK